MRGTAISRIFRRLEERSIPVHRFHALEFFARTGEWQTTAYASKVAQLDAWEIDYEFEEELRRNLPGANISIGDSFLLARDPKVRSHYDLIVLDNPQGSYGPDDVYTEHFQALPLVLPMLKDPGLVIFNINRAPFDFEQHPQWRKRREAWYGINTTDNIPIDFLLEHYRRYFRAQGYETGFCFNEPRNADYLEYLVYSLTPISSR